MNRMIYIYIYIYKEREREKERKRGRYINKLRRKIDRSMPIMKLEID